MIYKKIGIFLLCFATCMASSDVKGAQGTAQGTAKSADLQRIRSIRSIEHYILHHWKVTNDQLQTYLNSGILQASINTKSGQSLTPAQTAVYNGSIIQSIDQHLTEHQDQTFLDLGENGTRFYTWFMMQVIKWKEENKIPLTDQDQETKKQVIKDLKDSKKFAYSSEEREFVRQDDLANAKTLLERTKIKAGSAMGKATAQGISAMGKATEQGILWVLPRF